MKDAAVSVTNVANPTTGNVGSSGTFTQTVSNSGPDPATNIQITETLPSGFTAGTPSQGTYNSATGVWTITSLANDNSATLVFTGPLTAGEAGTTIVNGATETQNEYPLTVTVPSASIYVNKAVVSVTNVANPSTGNVGNTGTFTLTATNNGPDSATNVVITDPLPSGFTAGTPSQGTYDAATGVWNIGTLANSASVTLTFTGTLAANQAGNNHY